MACVPLCISIFMTLEWEGATMCIIISVEYIIGGLLYLAFYRILSFLT